MCSVGRRTEAPCAMRQRNACGPREAVMTSRCSERPRNRPMHGSICANAATKTQRLGRCTCIDRDMQRAINRRDVLQEVIGPRAQPGMAKKRSAAHFPRQA